MARRYAPPSARTPPDRSPPTRLESEHGGEMPYAGHGAQYPLESEARHGIRDDAARIRHPVPRDADDVESGGPAERAKLTARDEIVRGPVALVGPEVSRTIGRQVVAEEPGRATQAVVRLHDEQMAARTHRAPERLEQGRPSMEMMQALDHEGGIDGSLTDTAREGLGGSADRLHVRDALILTTRLEDLPEVGHRFERDDGVGAARDHRGEVAGPRSDLEGTAVPVRRPRLGHQDARWILELLLFLVAVSAIVGGGPLSGMNRLVDDLVDPVELEPRVLGEQGRLREVRQQKVQEIVPPP